ncbi:MAG: hypothetical protein OXI24_21170 [Candidatus Poribacteria bacterium]|nr:hypothetical protein [Candidatus Poribacteria bacterium]MDE0556732.1 hypothetical protein [Candidatus Poribacteria bacterium]MYK17738.1 hypothetical protein [Candidatus Poribacteria bacterium]
MFRFLFFSLLLVSIGVLCWRTPISAHDAFYPHHREDFENMTRRRQLRGTVILSTIVFVGVVGAVIYVALRKSIADDKTDQIETKTVQERLTYAANSAAKAAQHALNAKRNIKEAATTALTTYAEASGVTWRPHSYGSVTAESVPYHIRCKIGNDVVTLSINANVIHLKADHQFSKTGFSSAGVSKGVSATAVLKIRGEEEA